jgi:signal transduction histidine kinase
MSPLKLHVKTTLITSTITVAVLIAALASNSTRIINQAHEDQKELAELEAINLADHLEQLQSAQSDADLLLDAKLVGGGRPNLIGMRIWKSSANGFEPQIATSGWPPAQAIPEASLAMLMQGKVAEAETEEYSGPKDTHYHVYAPITKNGAIAGAVEVVERLDDWPSIALSYARNAAWLALVAVLLTSFSTYLLFRTLIYRPIESLLSVIARARRGELTAQAPPRPIDEVGLLSQEFNSLLGQIHEMTRERERHQDVLRERVQEATAQLQQRNEQLEATNLELWRTSRRLTQLERLAAAEQTAAKFAHEVGTPLNLISCHIQLLRDELYENPQSAEARTEIIGEQIDRIERIVRQMMDNARGEASTFLPLDLNALLGRIASATAPLAEERGVWLTTDFAPGLPPIAGDADRLQQAFNNLVNNALDAMPEGGELRLATKLELPADGQNIIVEVNDTGYGMNEETRARLFDQLYTTKEKGKGTGLGLVVVSQVVQEHGGQITVESALNAGARFRLSFPAASGRPASSVASSSMPVSSVKGEYEAYSGSGR